MSCSFLLLIYRLL